MSNCITNKYDQQFIKIHFALTYRNRAKEHLLERKFISSDKSIDTLKLFPPSLIISFNSFIYYYERNNARI